MPLLGGGGGRGRGGGMLRGSAVCLFGCLRGHQRNVHIIADGEKWMKNEVKSRTSWKTAQRSRWQLSACVPSARQLGAMAYYAAQSKGSAQIQPDRVKRLAVWQSRSRCGALQFSMRRSKSWRRCGQRSSPNGGRNAMQYMRIGPHARTKAPIPSQSRVR